MSARSPWQEPLTHPAAGDHIAQVYQDEAFLAEAACHFIAAGLRDDEGVLVIPTAAHWVEFRIRLEGEGVDVERHLRSGQLMVLDAEHALSRFMTEGMPDWTAFRKLVGASIERLRQGCTKLRAFGEMVDLLRRDANREAATCLEEFWNKIVKSHGISLFCAYHLDPLDAAAYGGPLEDICRTHTHLIPGRDYERLDRAVLDATTRVLDASLVGMLRALAHLDLPQTKMPFGQAVLLWLRKNMPLTADRVLSEVREIPAPTSTTLPRSLTSAPRLG